jgi:phosphonate transport system substrate-binding protein
MKHQVRQRFAQQQARAATVRRRLRVLAGAAVVLITSVMAEPAVAPTVFKVRAGDTFSGIASKVTGKAWDWNRLYDPQRSQLSDPNFITPGMRFQLVTEADGSRYLRAATSAQLAAAKTQQGKTAVVASTTTNKSAAAAVKPAPAVVAQAVAAQAKPLPAALPKPVISLPPPASLSVPRPVPVPVTSAPVAAPLPLQAALPVVKPVPVPVPVVTGVPGITATKLAAATANTPTLTTPSPALAALPTPSKLLPSSGTTNSGTTNVPVPLPAGLTRPAPVIAAAPALPLPAAGVAAVAAPAAATQNNAATATATAGTTATATAGATATATVITPLVAGGDALVIGVMPNLSASLVASQYDSLKIYLERSTSQKVRIVVPANMKAYVEATLRGDYDLAIGGPHFARLAQVDARWVPVAQFEPRTNAQFITLLDGPMKSLRDLRGKAVVFSNPQSLVAMYGRQWLSQQNLEQGKDYDVKSARTDLGVGRMLLSGDAVAAVMSGGEFRALPPEEAARLKIVEVIARIPNFVVLAHPRLGTERVARIKAKLQTFLADKDQGQAFAKATGVSGIVDADETMLREVDAFVATTRRMMVPAP